MISKLDKNMKKKQMDNRKIRLKKNRYMKLEEKNNSD